MNFWEAVRVALASLWSHKLRSVLTLIGVIIGVTAVIAVVSFVDGLNAYIAERVFNLGADVFLVSRESPIITNIDQVEEARKRRDLKFEDYLAVREACRECQQVGASLFRMGEVVYRDNSVTDTRISGWTETMPRIYDVNVALGRQLTAGDVEHAAPVCVIGTDIHDQLFFAGQDPIGRELRVDGASFEIIGLAEKRGSALGQSRDNFVIIPITTWQKRYGTRQSVRIWGKAQEEGRLPAAMDQVRLILRARRHLAYAHKDDFEIQTNSSFLAIWGDISTTFFQVTIGLAAISLVVGGIVIMNIMLVSVTERTREIGIRKAIGARRRDILLQFLIEASTIAFVGGFWGVVGGVGLAQLVAAVTPLPATVKLWSVVMGLLVATSVGLFFGIYPANRAARLDPVAALRAE